MHRVSLLPKLAKTSAFEGEQPLTACHPNRTADGLIDFPFEAGRVEFLLQTACCTASLPARTGWADANCLPSTQRLSQVELATEVSDGPNHQCQATPSPSAGHRGSGDASVRHDEILYR